jgi:hypothetical protein
LGPAAARSPPARSGGLAHVDEAMLFVLFAASHDAAYATGTECVADSGYLLAPVDATSGPPLHHAAVVILLAALRRTHVPASPAARRSGAGADRALTRDGGPGRPTVAAPGCLHLRERGDRVPPCSKGVVRVPAAPARPPWREALRRRGERRPAHHVRGSNVASNGRVS